MLYAEWLILWLDNKSSMLKPASYQTYMYAINGHIIPMFKEKEVEEISNESIIKAIDAWEKENLSLKTIRDLTVIVKTTLSDYSRINNVNLPLINVRIPKKSRNNIKIFSKEDQRQIIHGAFDSRTPKSLGIALGLCAGLRIGEVCGLRWRDIDLSNKLIYINSTVQRIYDRKQKRTVVRRGTPKTDNSIRVIPIATTLYTLLSIVKKEKQSPDDFVITGSLKYSEPKTYRAYYYNFLKRLRIERLPFHSLRHSFGTTAIRCGMDAKTLQELLGHSTISITLSLYVHPQIDDKRIALERLETLWL